MNNYILVALGGMCGAVARYAMSSALFQAFPTANFPIGTYGINLLGCFLIGGITGWIEKLSLYNAELRLLLITGFLGGFTTFSAFGIETLQLLRSGELFLGLLYASTSVVLGTLFVYLGMRLVNF